MGIIMAVVDVTLSTGRVVAYKAGWGVRYASVVVAFVVAVRVSA